jgi:TonB family protein
MKRHMLFGIAVLIGTALLFAKGNPPSKGQSKESPVATQSQSQTSSSEGYTAPPTSASGAPQVVFKVCSKKNPPPCAKPPHAVFAPEPEYSEEARKANYRGFCTLKMIVETNGRPSNIRVVGHAGMGLDENAIQAVKKWRFDPAMHDGKPVPVEVTVEVVFHL